jgi:hypothetical protein
MQSDQLKRRDFITLLTIADRYASLSVHQEQG